mmetsp:Transcript_45978/g.84492  ORF Transcript_45978/g.84492 Transcript_45978/m.84492 type:complete len:141 (-) Transcript_45978:99-521(-)
MHNDNQDYRVVSINIWLATAGWKPEWGGNFLWCGVSPFKQADRVLLASNRAGIFIPHNSTRHAVEPIKSSKPKSQHRFSLTSFIRTRFKDESDFGFHKAALEFHQAVLTGNQAEKKRVGSFLKEALNKGAKFSNPKSTEL